MPSWQKVIVSGSAANLSSLKTDTFISASNLTVFNNIYDSVNSTGSLNSVLVSSATGLKWAISSSGGAAGSSPSSSMKGNNTTGSAVDSDLTVNQVRVLLNSYGRGYINSLGVTNSIMSI